MEIQVHYKFYVKFPEEESFCEWLSEDQCQTFVWLIDLKLPLGQHFFRLFLTPFHIC